MKKITNSLPSLRAKEKKEKVSFHFLSSYWWIYIFTGVSLLLCFQGIQKKNRAYLDLAQKWEMLQRQKDSLLSEKEDLLLQINSQNDSDWLELVLRKNLGVVSEDEVKVFFERK